MSTAPILQWTTTHGLKIAVVFIGAVVVVRGARLAIDHLRRRLRRSRQRLHLLLHIGRIDAAQDGVEAQHQQGGRPEVGGGCTGFHPTRQAVETRTIPQPKARTE